MPQSRPQTPVLIFSIIAVIAMIVVVFLLNRLTSTEPETKAPTEPSAQSEQTNHSEDGISLTVNGKHVDDDDTSYNGTAEELVGHISEVMIRANQTGNLQPFTQLIGPDTLTTRQIAHLQSLAAASKLKLNQSRPFSLIAKDTSRWSLNLADDQSIELKLSQTPNGDWKIKSIALPKTMTQQGGSDSAAENTPTPPAETQTDLAAKTVNHFIQAILKLDPTAAGQYIDTDKISYATLAGLCIIAEEGRYQLVKEKSVRNMFLSNNSAGWLIRIESPDTDKPAMLALSTKRSSPQEPWLISEINLDKLLSDFASRYSGGDIHYLPLVKNPKGGDSIVLYFELDSNELTKRTQKQLQIIAQILKSTSEKKLTISGHTDASGSDQHNLGLSNQRAQQVMTFLASQGVTKAQMVVSSFGKSQPRRPNTTDDGRRANRRAEIRLDF